MEGVLVPDPVGDPDCDPALFAPDPDAEAAEGDLSAMTSLSEYSRSMTMVSPAISLWSWYIGGIPAGQSVVQVATMDTSMAVRRVGFGSSE